MTYNASITASEAGRRINNRVRRAHESLTELRSDSLTQAIAAGRLLSVMDFIYEANAVINTLANTAGLDEYFKEEYKNPLYDTLVELETQRVALADVGVTIRNAFPISTNGYIEQHIFVNVIEREDRTFSTAGLAPLRAKIDVFLALVSVVS